MAKVSFNFHNDAKWFEMVEGIDDRHLVFDVELDNYVFEVHWVWRDDAIPGFDFSAELAWSPAWAFEGVRYASVEELIRETRRHIGLRVLEYEREERLANENEVSRVVQLMERVARRRAGKAQWEARKHAEQKALEDRERRGKLIDRLSGMVICLACGLMVKAQIEDETISEQWDEEAISCYAYQCPQCSHKVYISQDPQ